MDATPLPQPPTPQARSMPFAVWNPIRGIWETSQLDLYGLLAPVCRPRGYVDRLGERPGGAGVNG